MVDREITKGDNFQIEVTNIDNELRIELNGSLIYHKGQDSDPVMDPPDVIDLTDRLAVGINNIAIALSNWESVKGNPWHVKYQVKHKDAVISDVDSRGKDKYGGVRFRDELIIKVT